jgi:hypothetical protein
LLVSNIELKSKILTKKGYLISDPVVKEMNPTQWAFQLLSYNEEQDNRYEEITSLAQLFKTAAINLLGLNIAPIEEEDPETGVTKLRPPKDHEFTPLSVLLASPEMLSGIIEKHDELQVQEQVDAELEEDIEVPTAEDLDKEFGDIEFMEDLETLQKKAAWESPEALHLRKLFITDEKELGSIDEMLSEPDEREKRQMAAVRRLPKKTKLIID